MAKATKQLGGAAKDKYFRELFAAAPGLAPVMARRLAELTRAEVSQVRIRQPLLDRARHFGAEATAGLAGGSDASAKVPVAQPAAPRPAAGVAAEAPSRTNAGETTAGETLAAEAFDPFAFTAVVVLKRQGADVLKQRLAEIDEPAHLRLLADKQHLGVPADAKDAASLREAILAAAQARIDDRRAAAS